MSTRASKRQQLIKESTLKAKQKANSTKTSIVNVQLNDKNEIEFLEVANDEHSQDNNLSEEEEEENSMSEGENEEPELVETSDGHMMIKIEKEATVVEHVCGKCNKSFQLISSLKRHLNLCRNTPKKDVKQENMPTTNFDKDAPQSENTCYCCGEDIESAHSGHIRCNHCPKSFKGLLGLEKHLFSLHSASTNFPCTLCNATCPNKKILELHNESHKNGKPFACTKCGKDFTRKYHLERHLAHTGCDKTRPKVELPCEVCNKMFSRTDNLREHLRGHMRQTIRRKDYQCTYCDKAFYGSSLLNIHIRTHTGERPFACDLCTKSFPSNGALRKHRRMHTGEKPYVCKVCDARFSAKETLNRHNKIHTGEKPHICSVCGKCFIQATQLRSHMFYHTGENGFQCNYCNRAFNRKSRLTSHIKYIHEGAKPLECHRCQKTYTSKEDLSRHLDNHDGVKRHNCATCEKKFSSKAALKIHERIHTREEKCTCTECNKSFIRLDCLIRHMRAKHRDVLVKIMNDAEQKKLNKSFPNLIKESFISSNEGNTDEDEEDEENEDNNLEYGEIANDKELPSTSDKDKKLRHANKDADNVANEEEDNEEGEEEEEEEMEYEVYEEEEEEATTNKTENKLSLVAIKEEKGINKNVPADNTDREQEEEISINEDTIFMDDKTLKDSIGDLLNLLVDEETLNSFGWPITPVEEVLSSVIKHCGHKPADYNDCIDYTSKMRENTKLLFTVVIDNESIKSLLNNHTVDEVILHVLKLAKNK